MFDVFFPATYPSDPPLVHFDTTDGGRASFNVNLYSDGKVCLSLLGTTGGGDATQKWQPGVSTLLQVLLSIQASACHCYCWWLSTSTISRDLTLIAQ